MEWDAQIIQFPNAVYCISKAFRLLLSYHVERVIIKQSRPKIFIVFVIRRASSNIRCHRDLGLEGVEAVVEVVGAGVGGLGNGRKNKSAILNK